MDVKTVLEEREMPTHWYNIQADLPRPLDPPPSTPEPNSPPARMTSPRSSRWGCCSKR